MMIDMTDMIEVLDRLKEAEPKTYQEIKYYVTQMEGCLEDEEGNPQIAATLHYLAKYPRSYALLCDSIQGCIQRAIAARGWSWDLRSRGSDRPFARILIPKSACDAIEYGSSGATPVEAILASYLAALEAQ